MPEGLNYVDSWVEPTFERCFQLMESEDPALFAQWTANWDDLMEFEIVRPRINGIRKRKKYIPLAWVNRYIHTLLTHLQIRE